MNELTQDFFKRAGIINGMTVLDVGCGGGVTTELLAELVGPTGKVIGVDPKQKAIDMATQKAHLNNWKNIEYICADIHDFSADEVQFDAIVGRRVLVYLDDPKLAINKLIPFLKPGGIIAFQEHDSTSIINQDKMPLHHKVSGWIWDLVEKNGGNINIGKEIWHIFSQESLNIKDVQAKPIIQTPDNDISLAPIIQALSGLLIMKNIAPESELTDHLLNSLEKEKRESGCIFIRENIFFIKGEKI